MVELRKELVASQRIRAQVMGFKIAFVSAGIGLIVANMDAVPSQLLVIPAFAAVFFDLVINSYSFSIKRIGCYCRSYIEPILREYSEWPKEAPLWEEFMDRPEVKQNLARSGNLGISGLTVAAAIFALFNPFSFNPSSLIYSGPAFFFLILLFGYDVVTYRWPHTIIEKWQKKRKTDLKESSICWDQD